MKTALTCLLTACLLFSWCSLSSAQQNASAAGEKKIVITKRTVEADGTEVTETIVKKGAAAADFDVDKYVRENRSSQMQVDVRVEDVRSTSHSTRNSTWTKDGQRGFLGVFDLDAMEEGDGPAGVLVKIAANAAAARAGLQDGDMILQLNDTPVSDFEDIRTIMADTRSGDKMRVTYQRDSRRATVEITLGEAQDRNREEEDDDEEENEDDWNTENWSQGDRKEENVDVDVQQKEACLGVYTEGLEPGEEGKGARILSFTAESVAKEVQMQENDVITAINGQRVQDHSELWAEIAKYKAGDRVQVDYLRNGEKRNVEAALKPCQDDDSRITMAEEDDQGGQKKRQFNTWNWNSNDQTQLRQTRLITIHKGAEGDAAQVNTPPSGSQPVDRQLQLESFRASPNPAPGQVTVEFRGAPVATIVSLLDGSGRQLFREELNMFNGTYQQQFDLSEYAKSAVVVLIQQGAKSFTAQVVIN